MIVAGKLDLSGDRWTPFDAIIRFEGIDLTNAVMEAHIRQDFDSPGSPLVDLDTVLTANTQGIRLLSVVTENGAKVSTVQMRVNETTMEGLPTADELGKDAKLAWDILINPSAVLNTHLPAVKQRYLRGSFTVEAGATQ